MAVLRRKTYMRIIGELNQLTRIVRILAFCACLAAVSPLSYAQDDKKPAAAAEDHKQITLEPMTVTVTVTAEKESEPALTIPLSVTAVTLDNLTDADIQAVKQAAVFAPNTFINEFTARAVSNPYFRGIGGSPTNPGVSTVIDGVPQLNSYSSNIELVDVGQIEFVRGPEGALYGRNTAGGLINITSRSLSNTWTAQGQADFGNYDLRDLRASVSSPLLKDRFGISLAGGYSARDGYTVNDYTGCDVDSREAGFGKAQLFFKLNDRVNIRLIFSGEHDNDGDYALGDLGYVRAHPNHVDRDFVGYNLRSVGSATLVADYHGSSIDFSSISGGVWWKNHGLTDLDYQVATAANFGLYAIRDDAEQQHQFTQEFRFASSKDRPLNLNDAVKLDWQAGLFVFNQDYQQNTTNRITFGFYPTSVGTTAADLGDSGMGIYGQARFTAWKRLSFTAGLRFDYEDKTADLRSSTGPSTSASKN